MLKAAKLVCQEAREGFKFSNLYLHIKQLLLQRDDCGCSTTDKKGDFYETAGY